MGSGNVIALHDEDSVPEGFVELPVPEYRVEFGFKERGKRLKVTVDKMIPILFDGYRDLM